MANSQLELYMTISTSNKRICLPAYQAVVTVLHDDEEDIRIFVGRRPIIEPSNKYFHHPIFESDERITIPFPASRFERIEIRVPKSYTGRLDLNMHLSLLRFDYWRGNIDQSSARWFKRNDDWGCHQIRVELQDRPTELKTENPASSTSENDAVSPRRPLLPTEYPVAFLRELGWETSLVA